MQRVVGVNIDDACNKLVMLITHQYITIFFLTLWSQIVQNIPQLDMVPILHTAMVLRKCATDMLLHHCAGLNTPRTAAPHRLASDVLHTTLSRGVNSVAIKHAAFHTSCSH